MNKAVLEEIKEKAIPVLKHSNIKKAALFGSYVRGDYTKDSDVDILVAFPEDATLIDVVRLKRNLEEELDKRVDIISYNGIYPPLKNAILNNQYPVL